MKRIFVGIKLSEKVQKTVSDYIKDLKKEFPNLRVGWEKSEKLHLTLKFLGDIDNESLKRLQKVTDKTASNHKSFKLKISKNGVFQNKRRPRILWLEVIDEENNLLKIKNELENDLEKIGFEKEKRKFKPHLTIARIREPKKSKSLVEKHLKNNFEPIEFEVSEIVIFESELKPTGSIYKIVSRFSLN